MRAVILAAGVGRRLRPFTDRHPKCLLRFGGRTLLERHLAALTGIAGEVVIVVGHLADQVRAEVERLALSVPVSLVENPRFEEGSALSVLAAVSAAGGGECLVMDADLLLAPSLYRRLAEAKRPNCLLADPKLVDTGEEVKVVVDPSGHVRGLGKTVRPTGRVFGESVGAFKFDGQTMSKLVERLREWSGRDPRLEYEPVIDSLLDEVEVGLESTDGLPWLEIDFPKDVVRASREVFPLLGEDGEEPPRLPLGPQLEVLQRIAQPEGLGPAVSDVAYRALSFLPSVALGRLGVSANAITIGWILIGLVGIVLIGVGSPVSGGILLQISYLLDFVDGEVARLRGSMSRLGQFLDLVGHGLLKASLFLGVGFNIFLTTGSSAGLLLSFVATVALATGSMLPTFAHEASLTDGGPGGDGLAKLLQGRWQPLKRVTEVGNLIFESPGLYGLVLLGALFGRLPAVLMLYAWLTPLWFLYRIRRYGREPRSG